MINKLLFYTNGVQSVLIFGTSAGAAVDRWRELVTHLIGEKKYRKWYRNA